MSVNAWFNQFRALHERARKKDLSDSDKKSYLEAREQFARAMTAAQGLTLMPGQSARQAFRVAQAMQVEFSFATGPLRAVTQDVSWGGFSTLLAKAPDTRDAVGFSLKLPGASEPLVGRAKVASAKKQPGNFRVSFTFEGLSEADQERLELAMLDAALARIPS